MHTNPVCPLNSFPACTRLWAVNYCFVSIPCNVHCHPFHVDRIGCIYCQWEKHKIKGNNFAKKKKKKKKKKKIKKFSKKKKKKKKKITIIESIFHCRNNLKLPAQYVVTLSVCIFLF